MSATAESSDKANHIADYFQSISNKSLKNPDGFEKLVHSTINTDQNKEYNKPLTLQEMITVLSNIKNISAEDEIPYLLIKNLEIYNKKEVLNIYNTCLQTGYFPDIWRASLYLMSNLHY